MPDPGALGHLLDARHYGVHGYPHETWARLRREAPVAWVEPDEGIPYWAITRRADIVRISREPSLFTNRPRFKASVGGEESAKSPTLSSMDPPEHQTYRQLVSRRFTPRALARLRDPIEAVAAELMEGLGEPGAEVELDFVDRVAAPMPILIIAWLMGLPREDWRLVYGMTHAMTGFADPEYQQPGETPADTIARGRREIYAYFAELAAARRARPGDDLVSLLARAEIDGRPIGQEELLAYYLILIVAGNETTRNAISGGVHALANDPASWRRLRRDPALVPTAVEEILRHGSPVIHHARTAARDVELRGVKISKGETLALFYPSANRDETVFDAPEAFRIDRRPNPHLAFGVGEHVCLGAHLARIEIELVLRHLARRVETFEVLGPVERLASANVGGIKNLRVRMRMARLESASKPA
ncbi:MAG: cytochrome P450 [Spirochaetaceae bacterium]|nr:cytochrome P450 [Myxococcales bacterium]MCB9725701.1 cytochrome P450 [Spirochaetaceae bacterium]